MIAGFEIVVDKDTVLSHEVPSVDVVDQAVAVIVDFVRSDLTLVGPDLIPELFMPGVDARIYDGNGGGRRARM